MKKIAVIILAAGDSTRMKSAYPKVLHKVAGLPLISHTLRQLDGIEEIEKIIIVIGYQAQKVREEIGDKYEYVEQKKRLGTADAVRVCEDKLENFDGEVLVLAGDVPLITSETLKTLIRKHSEEDLAVSILTSKVKDPTGYGRIIRKDNGKVSRIVEEIDAGLFEKTIEEINSSIYIFKWNILKDALGKIKINKKKNEYFLTDAIGEIARSGEEIDAFLIEDSDEITGINSRIQLAEAERKMKKRINRRLMENGVTIVDPETTFIDEDVEIQRDTIIYPFTVIEGPVSIGLDCRIGPFTHIRGGGKLEDGVEIGNFVEVKKCLIGKGTKAKHLTYLGDGEIGSKVNVGAGTIIANYDGKKKHKSRIEDGAFIGSGTILVAPVSVGKNALTGAGSVVLRNRDVPDGAVAVGVPAKILEKK